MQHAQHIALGIILAGALAVCVGIFVAGIIRAISG